VSTTQVRDSRKLLPIALIGLAVLVVAGCGPMDGNELRREVETNISTASEAMVLAERVALQETKRTFTRVQARELADAAQHSAERLTDAHAEAGLQEFQARAIGLAEDVEAAVGQLETAPADADAAVRAEARLRNLASKLSNLADSI
jgi:hypothetical protein